MAFLCFSPERIDPGNQKYKPQNIPKVVGGITPKCTKVASVLYAQIMQTVIPVSSSRTAEMAKLLEIYRPSYDNIANKLTLFKKSLVSENYKENSRRRGLKNWYKR